MKSLLQVTISKMILNDLDEVLAIENKSYPTPWTRRAFHSNSPTIFMLTTCSPVWANVGGLFGMWIILMSFTLPT